MAGKTVTLYIDDTSLRLIVTQGKQIREWADSNLEPGLVEKNVIINEEEIVTRIQQLFSIKKISTKKIILGVSGLHCFTRPVTLPKLPKEMLDEAVRREAQRALPVSLEELYISWQNIPSPEENTQVFMVGIPRRMADSVLNAVQKAGLKATFMDIKPLLLARTVKEPAAVIVDVQATEFDIVISIDGVPQPVRSISFTSESLTSEEKLINIKDELNRTTSFYNSNNPERALDSSVPVYVSGELANEAELCESLSSDIDQPVLPLPSPLEYPEGFDQSYYTANICLSSWKDFAKGDATTTVISVNSLPVQYQPKPISIMNIVAIPSAIIAVVLLVALVWFIQTTASNIDSANLQLSNASQILQQKQLKQQKINNDTTKLEEQISNTEKSHEIFTAALGVIEAQTEGTNSELEIAMGSLSANVRLVSVSHITSILTVTGNATNESQILDYLTKLDDSGKFGNLTVIDTTRDENENFIFTVLGTIITRNLGISSMEVALGSLPSGIDLTMINSDENTLTLEGIAVDEDEILIYLRTLEASGIFEEIIITRITRTGEGENEFSLILEAKE